MLSMRFWFDMRLRKWYLAGFLMLSVLLAIYQVKYSYYVDLGGASDSQLLDGFYPPEKIGDIGYRWSSDKSTITFPGVTQNQRYELVLNLAAGSRPANAPAPELTIEANQTRIQALDVEPTLQSYQVALEPEVVSQAPNLGVSLEVPTFTPGPKDLRELGVIVNWVRLRPLGNPAIPVALPPLYYALVWVLCGWLWLGILLHTRLARSPSLLAIAMLFGASAMGLGAMVNRVWMSLMITSISATLVITLIAAIQIPEWLKGAGTREKGTLWFLHTLGIANPSWRALLEGVIIVAVATYFLFDIVLPLRTHGLIDFMAYYAASWLGVHGGNYYDYGQMLQFVVGHHLTRSIVNYVNPPSGLVFLSWLTIVPVSEFKLVWLLCNYVAMIGGGVFLVLALRSSSAQPLSPLWVAAMLALSRPLRTTFESGQIGVFIFLFLALGFWAWTRRLEILAGGAIALATAIKVSPGILLAYFLWKRAWRAVAGGLITVATLLLLSLSFGGTAAWVTFFTRVLPAASEITAYVYNQSLVGFIERLFVPFAGPPRFTYSYEPSGDPSSLVLRLISFAIVFGSTGLITLWIRGGPAPSALIRQLEYGAVLSVMLVVTPLVWDHYSTWLILPMAVILNTLTALRLDVRAKIGLTLATGVSWLLLQEPIGGPYESGPPPVLLQSPYLYASIILSLSLLFLLRTLAQTSRLHEVKKMQTTPAHGTDPPLVLDEG